MFITRLLVLESILIFLKFRVLSALPVCDWDTLKEIDYCPFEPYQAYELVWHPPAPTGNVNTIQLPNDAQPSVELSLTVKGEDDKYPFHVGQGGYGGRVVDCIMPEPSFDNQIAMARLGPTCSLSEPPVMKCTPFDAWLDKAPGGPLFDLIHAGADNTVSYAPLLGEAALREIPLLYDKFIAADLLVKKAKWKSGLIKDENKASELLAKDLVASAKAAVRFWSEDWGGVKGGRPSKCFENLEAFVNTTVRAEKELKENNKDRDALHSEYVNRLTERRDKLTKFSDGRFPGGFVEEMKLDTRDVWGRTLLHWAAAAGQELLFSAGEMQPEAWSHVGKQAASIEKWGELVVELLERGASPNVCDADGRTPLDLAVSAENVMAVKALLSYGAGLDTQNRWKLNIHDMAQEVNAGNEIREMLGLPPSNYKQQMKFQNKFNNQNNSYVGASQQSSNAEFELLSELAALAGETK